MRGRADVEGLRRAGVKRSRYRVKRRRTIAKRSKRFSEQMMRKRDIQSTIRKHGYRFSERITLDQNARRRLIHLKRHRSSLPCGARTCHDPGAGLWDFQPLLILERALGILMAALPMFACARRATSLFDLHQRDHAQRHRAVSTGTDCSAVAPGFICSANRASQPRAKKTF